MLHTLTWRRLRVRKEHIIYTTHSANTDRHLAAVAVEAVEVHRDINVEYIAILPPKKKIS